MADIAMPCEDCEQGQSTCCRLVRAWDIEMVLPEECWVFRVLATTHVNCTRLIGGKIGEGDVVWTEEMCCLPCRVRLVIERTAKTP